MFSFIGFKRRHFAVYVKTLLGFGRFGALFRLSFTGPASFSMHNPVFDEIR